MYRHCTGVDIYILQLSVTAACKPSKCLSPSSSAIPIVFLGEDDPESVQVEGGWRCALHDGDLMGI